LPIIGKPDARAAAPGETRGAAGAATVLGARSRVVGELAGDEDVVVLGRFEGTLRVGERVTVGPGGDVEGDIHARAVLVQGRVKGQIQASERAELGATAVVEGGVESPKVVIAEGALLTGSVAMSPRPAAESKPEE
jgi:cytoskeletal protein CcmA (bactofilin family)